MEPQSNVPSFDLDHTKVRAPYVRFAGQATGPRGDVVSKYDLRLTQPNTTAIDTATVHTLEHLLAGYLRDNLGDDMIDVSPMGCRTGFYLTMFGDQEEPRVLEAFSKALENISEYDAAIPGVSEERCGNFRDHSKDGAKRMAQRALSEGIIVQKTVLMSE